MKTIDLASGVPSLQELLSLAGEENVILRTVEGKEFVLAEVDDFEREVELVRNQSELVEFLDQRSKPEPRHTLNEARQALGL